MLTKDELALLDILRRCVAAKVAYSLSYKDMPALIKLLELQGEEARRDQVTVDHNTAVKLILHDHRLRVANARCPDPAHDSMHDEAWLSLEREYQDQDLAEPGFVRLLRLFAAGDVARAMAQDHSMSPERAWELTAARTTRA